MSSNHRVFPRPDRPLSTQRDSQPEDKSAELFRPCLQLGIPWKLLSEATGISGGFREPALTHCPELDLLLALDLSVIAVFSLYHFRLSSFLEHRVNKSLLGFQLHYSWGSGFCCCCCFFFCLSSLFPSGFCDVNN